MWNTPTLILVCPSSPIQGGGRGCDVYRALEKYRVLEKDDPQEHHTIKKYTNSPHSSLTNQ